MTRYLLDTNVVSEPARPYPSSRVLEHYRAHDGAMAIPSVVWSELVYGVERLAAGRQRAYLAQYLAEVVRPALPVLPYDEAAAAWHGRARARLAAAGAPRPFADGMIAAVAATRGLILVTRNRRDFDGFADLHLEDWFAP